MSSVIGISNKEGTSVDREGYLKGSSTSVSNSFFHDVIDVMNQIGVNTKEFSKLVHLEELSYDKDVVYAPEETERILTLSTDFIIRLSNYERKTKKILLSDNEETEKQKHQSHTLDLSILIGFCALAIGKNRTLAFAH